MNSLVTMHNQVKGYWLLEAVTLDNVGNEVSRRQLLPIFPNLIVDQGLDRMGDNSDWLNCCQVGTGSTAPANSDVALASYLVGSSTITTTSRSSSPTSPYYGGLNLTFRFGTGVAAGNLTEIGVGWATSGNTLYSRALILDGGGIPTTITVLATEVLDATYIWRIYAPLVDITSSITISTVSYNYTIRASKVTTAGSFIDAGWGMGSSLSAKLKPLGSSGNIGKAYTGALGAITSSPAGTTTPLSVFGSTTSDAPYVPGTLYRDSTLTIGLSEGNLTGGINSLLFSFEWCSYQIEFTPKIPKDNTKTFALTFRQTWARRP